MLTEYAFGLWEGAVTIVEGTAGKWQNQLEHKSKPSQREWVIVTAPLLQMNAIATAVFFPLASSPPTILFVALCV